MRSRCVVIPEDQILALCDDNGNLIREYWGDKPERFSPRNQALTLPPLILPRVQGQMCSRCVVIHEDQLLA